MTDLGTLSPVNVRDVWPGGEAGEFTPWLAENADLLGEALGLDLVHERTEAEVGRYSADLLFREESTNRLVVVENMFGPTDHDHLGKLITYAAGLGARCAVLISPEYRAEHLSAVSWLNSISADDFAFFGVVLEAWRIDESRHAPRLRVVVQPDSWSRLVRATQGTQGEKGQMYQRFWGEFLQAFREAHPDWRNRRNPVTDSWMDFASGRTGYKFNAAFCRLDGKRRLRSEVYIDLGDREANKREFDRLHNDRAEIEQAAGGALEWARLDDKKASRISLYYAEPIDVSEHDRWPGAQKWLVDAMGRMREAFRGRLEVAA